jgi:hypothetical protein
MLLQQITFRFHESSTLGNTRTVVVSNQEFRKIGVA